MTYPDIGDQIIWDGQVVGNVINSRVTELGTTHLTVALLPWNILERNRWLPGGASHDN